MLIIPAAAPMISLATIIQSCNLLHLLFSRLGTYTTCINSIAGQKLSEPFLIPAIIIHYNGQYVKIWCCYFAMNVSIKAANKHLR